jgi:hypothetical protein
MRLCSKVLVKAVETDYLGQVTVTDAEVLEVSRSPTTTATTGWAGRSRPATSSTSPAS